MSTMPTIAKAYVCARRQTLACLYVELDGTARTLAERACYHIERASIARLDEDDRRNILQVNSRFEKARLSLVRRRRIMRIGKFRTASRDRLARLQNELTSIANTVDDILKKHELYQSPWPRSYSIPQV